MTPSVLPDLERDLVDAAARHAGSRAATPARSRSLVRWLLRRSRTAQVLAGLAVVAGAASAAAALSGTASEPLRGAVSANVRYTITLAPMMAAGTDGWCIGERQTTAAGRLAGGVAACGPDTAGLGSPMFASLPGKTIGVITARQVAAVRVVGGPTILTRADPGLPFGFRAAVYDVTRLTGSLRVTRRSFVALDAQGHAIAQGSSGRAELGPLGTPPQPLPTRAWARPGASDLISGLVTAFPHQQQPVAPAPARDRSCLTAARAGSGLRAQGGVDVTAIAPDPAIIGHAFLDCSDTVYSGPGGPVIATVLLDAKNPAAPPAALPGMRAVRGEPGTFTASGGPGLLASRALDARRDGHAWLVVQATRSQAHAIQALRALRITRIALRAPTLTPGGPRGVRCSIGYRPLAGLIETVQTPWRGAPPRWGPNPRLYPCTAAAFYLHNWPLQARVFAPINEPGTPHHPTLRPIPGHPHTFTVTANGYTGAGIWRPFGHAWLTITGGNSEKQRLALSDDLTVRLNPR